MADGAPVFIVGVPRSGTTLLAGMLCAHDRLSCGPETHFFVDLTPEVERRICSAANWPTAAVEYLFSIVQVGAPVPEHHELSRSDLASFLEERSPSIPSALASLTESYMRRTGKPRWMEKTPGHILNLDAIRRHFPDSPIVRIVRDPRDVALSLLKVPWGAKSFEGAILYWRRCHEKSDRFFRSDSLSMTLRYEDLVSSPEPELRRICDLIGETFSLDMLDTADSSKHVNKIKEPWKSNVGGGLDPSRIQGWRGKLSPEEIRIAETIAGDMLRRFKYEVSSDFVEYRPLYPSVEVLLKYPGVLRRLLDDRIRPWSETPGEPYRRRLFVGDPDADGWLDGTSTERLRKAIMLRMSIAAENLSGKPPLWWRDESLPVESSLCSKLCSASLRNHEDPRPTPPLESSQSAENGPKTKRDRLAPQS